MALLSKSWWYFISVLLSIEVCCSLSSGSSSVLTTSSDIQTSSHNLSSELSNVTRTVVIDSLYTTFKNVDSNKSHLTSVVEQATSQVSSSETVTNHPMSSIHFIGTDNVTSNAVNSDTTNVMQSPTELIINKENEFNFRTSRPFTDENISKNESSAPPHSNSMNAYSHTGLNNDSSMLETNIDSLYTENNTQPSTLDESLLSTLSNKKLSTNTGYEYFGATAETLNKVDSGNNLRMHTTADYSSSSFTIPLMGNSTGVDPLIQSTTVHNISNSTTGTLNSTFDSSDRSSNSTFTTATSVTSHSDNKISNDTDAALFTSEVFNSTLKQTANYNSTDGMANLLSGSNNVPIQTSDIIQNIHRTVHPTLINTALSSETDTNAVSFNGSTTVLKTAQKFTSDSLLSTESTSIPIKEEYFTFQEGNTTSDISTNSSPIPTLDENSTQRNSSQSSSKDIFFNGTSSLIFETDDEVNVTGSSSSLIKEKNATVMPITANYENSYLSPNASTVSSVANQLAERRGISFDQQVEKVANGSISTNVMFRTSTDTYPEDAQNTSQEFNDLSSHSNNMSIELLNNNISSEHLPFLPFSTDANHSTPEFVKTTEYISLNSTDNPHMSTSSIQLSEPSLQMLNDSTSSEIQKSLAGSENSSITAASLSPVSSTLDNEQSIESSSDSKIETSSLASEIMEDKFITNGSTQNTFSSFSSNGTNALTVSEISSRTSANHSTKFAFDATHRVDNVNSSTEHPVTTSRFSQLFHPNLTTVSELASHSTIKENATANFVARETLLNNDTESLTSIHEVNDSLTESSKEQNTTSSIWKEDNITSTIQTFPFESYTEASSANEPSDISTDSTSVTALRHIPPSEPKTRYLSNMTSTTVSTHINSSGTENYGQVTQASSTKDLILENTEKYQDTNLTTTFLRTSLPSLSIASIVNESNITTTSVVTPTEMKTIGTVTSSNINEYTTTAMNDIGFRNITTNGSVTEMKIDDRFLTNTSVSILQPTTYTISPDHMTINSTSAINRFTNTDRSFANSVTTPAINKLTITTELSSDISSDIVTTTATTDRRSTYDTNATKTSKTSTATTATATFSSSIAVRSTSTSPAPSITVFPTNRSVSTDSTIGKSTGTFTPINRPTGTAVTSEKSTITASSSSTTPNITSVVFADNEFEDTSLKIVPKDLSQMRKEEKENAVSIIFYTPELKVSDWISHFDTSFRNIVAGELKNYIKNNKEQILDSGIKNENIFYPTINDIYYIAPTPEKVDDNLLISFFICSRDTEEVFIRDILLITLQESITILNEQLGFNVTNIYYGFHEYSKDDTALTAGASQYYWTAIIVVSSVVGPCLIAMFAVMIYIRCNNRGRRYATDMARLKHDMNASNDLGNLNSAVDILSEEMTDKENVTFANSNGNHIIRVADDECWVVPFSDIPVEDKNQPPIQDTRL